jgi:two-component system chemotaxis sensor kinase CheA
MSQFHQVFLEESYEGLDSMETELLRLSEGDNDPELINSIFRAAHSIKGGSGTFGFSAVSQFTHVMETLLDEMRDGQRQVSIATVDLLLESVDVVRAMLAAVADGSDLDEARVADVQLRLEAMLGQPQTASVPPTGTVAPAAPAGWKIKFRPYPHLMQTGNDPVRMFRELATMGELQTRVDMSSLPAIAELVPEECYLAWELELTGDVDQAAIQEIFEWVDGDCELLIEPMHDAADTSPATTPSRSATDTGKEQAQNFAPVQSTTPGARRSCSTKAANVESSSIRVSIDKVDALINIVGEIVITQSMLGQIGADLQDTDSNWLARLRDGLQELERNTRELQEGVMQIRMLPISFSFNRFPRLVHDLGNQLGKKVELRLSGEQTELDKTVLEKIGDPLVHLVRNSMDHGIETPEIRTTKGKSETGVLHLNAFHQGGSIVIQISDDGAGFNHQRILEKARERGLVGAEEILPPDRIADLIFLPGFSTANEISDVSGRGVGMDVVRRNIHDLGGSVEVASTENRGTTFTIRLPLTLAILDGQLVRIGTEIYIIPLVSIVESLQLRRELINSVTGQAQVYRLRDEYIPIVNMHDVFGIPERVGEHADSLLVVVECDGHKVALVVDDLLGQQQVVIKSLESNFKRVEGVSGATILGDGTVALIADVGGLIRLGRTIPLAGKLLSVA